MCSYVPKVLCILKWMTLKIDDIYDIDYIDNKIHILQSNPASVGNIYNEYICTYVDTYRRVHNN